MTKKRNSKRTVRPNALKVGVAEVLIDSGLPELVPTAFGGTAE